MYIFKFLFIYLFISHYNQPPSPPSMPLCRYSSLLTLKHTPPPLPCHTPFIPSHYMQVHPFPLRPDYIAQLGKQDTQAGRQQIQEQSLLQLFRDPHQTQATYLLHMCRGLGPAHACYLVRSSVSGSPEVSRLVDSDCLLVEFLSCLDLSVFPSTLQQDSQDPFCVWLWISESVSVNCWVEPLKRQLLC